MADITTNNSTKTYLRYAGSSAVTIVTLLALLANVPPDQQQAFLAALHQFNDSILSAYGALTKMVLIAGPIGLGVLAKLGVNSGTVVNVIQRVLQIAQSGNTPQAAEAQKQLLDATTTVLNSPSIVPTTEVKAAVLNTAISMPEVSTKTIVVTDKALAAATPNDNVVAAPNAT